jgi:hypothetical protein
MKIKELLKALNKEITEDTSREPKSQDKKKKIRGLSDIDAASVDIRNFKGLRHRSNPSTTQPQREKKIRGLSDIDAAKIDIRNFRKPTQPQKKLSATDKTYWKFLKKGYHHPTDDS